MVTEFANLQIHLDENSLLNEYEKCATWPFVDHDPSSCLLHWLTKIDCLHDEVRTTHPITTKFGRCIPLVHYLIKFWCGFVGKFCGFIFASPDWSATNKKRFLAYWVHYVTSNFVLMNDLGLGAFKFKYWISHISIIVALIYERKAKQINWILDWKCDFALW